MEKYKFISKSIKGIKRTMSCAIFLLCAFYPLQAFYFVIRNPINKPLLSPVGTYPVEKISLIFSLGEKNDVRDAATKLETALKEVASNPEVTKALKELSDVDEKVQKETQQMADIIALQKKIKNIIAQREKDDALIQARKEASKTPEVQEKIIKISLSIENKLGMKALLNRWKFILEEKALSLGIKEKQTTYLKLLPEKVTAAQEEFDAAVKEALKAIPEY